MSHIGQTEVAKVLRYAELALAASRGKLQCEGSLPPRLLSEHENEMEKIRIALGSSHEEIMDLAQKNLIQDKGC
jgi:hypothetical protein